MPPEMTIFHAVLLVNADTLISLYVDNENVGKMYKGKFKTVFSDLMGHKVVKLTPEVAILKSGVGVKELKIYIEREKENE